VFVSPVHKPVFGSDIWSEVDGRKSSPGVQFRLYCCIKASRSSACHCPAMFTVSDWLLNVSSGPLVPAFPIPTSLGRVLESGWLWLLLFLQFIIQLIVLYDNSSSMSRLRLAPGQCSPVALRMFDAARKSETSSFITMTCATDGQVQMQKNAVTELIMIE
jgi:hypothetical protein